MYPECKANNTPHPGLRLCMCACVCALCVCVYRCVSSPVEVRTASGVTLHLLFETGSLIDLQSLRSSGLAGKEASRDPPAYTSYLPKAGVVGPHH